MKYIKTALAILLAGTLLCGCGDKASDDTDISGGLSAATSDTSDYNFFETADGLFSFGTPPDLAFREDDSVNDYEYSFTTGKENSLIGVMSVSGYHQTARGFGEGTLSDYEKVYSDVKGESITIGDVPAYQITAYSDKISYNSIMLQYGNGDLFVVNTTDNKGKNDAAKAAAALCSTIKYKGEPLKSSPETFENDYFSITVSEKWYFKSKDSEGVSVCLNLQESIEDMGYSFSLKALPKGGDITLLANERFGELSESGECRVEESEFLGSGAQSVFSEKQLGEITLKREHRYFKVNGTCFEAVLLCTDANKEQFDKDIQTITESIKFS